MVRSANKEDLAQVAALAAQLWQEHTAQELLEAFSVALEAGNSRFFLIDTEGQPAGFAQCQLRQDYVEGTQTSPVGYLEGIFVREGFRHRGFAVPCCKRARLGPESRAVRSSPATAPRKTSPASAFIERWNLKKRAGSSVSSSACDRPRVCLPYQRGAAWRKRIAPLGRSPFPSLHAPVRSSPCLSPPACRTADPGHPFDQGAARSRRATAAALPRFLCNGRPSPSPRRKKRPGRPLLAGRLEHEPGLTPFLAKRRGCMRCKWSISISVAYRLSCFAFQNASSQQRRRL